MKPAIHNDSEIGEVSDPGFPEVGRLKKMLSEKEALLCLARDAAHVRNRDGLKQLIGEKFEKLFGSIQVMVMCVSDDKKTMKCFVENCEQQLSDAFVSNRPVISERIYEEVSRSSGTMIFSVSDQANEFEMKPLHEAGIKEMAGIGLEHNNEVIGTMLLFSGDENAFTTTHCRLIECISHHLSAAVSNIIANEQLEQQFQEISKYKEKLEEERLYLQEEAGSGYTYNDIIGNGASMQHVFNLLSQVAFTQSSVLILGETGTGKELIARAIHNSSTRKGKLMVKVNCAALPASLIESELFGHEKGSFTGATERHIGKFELANHGTLFLDEIGEMPPDLQVKLLRAIQEKEIERIGGRGLIKTDVRIIAATNRNLQKEVAEGRFRSDLYYRLNVFPIMLPPLRERTEDIPLLAAHFAERFARNNGKKDVRIANSVMKELMAYPWPGNVRELEHLMERSILLNPGNIIKSIHLPPGKGPDVKGGVPLFNKTLEEVEREYIIGVLKQCSGKIYGPGGAAEILGLNVSTLNSRIKKLGIQRIQTFTVKKA